MILWGYKYTRAWPQRSANMWQCLWWRGQEEFECEAADQDQRPYHALFKSGVTPRFQVAATLPSLLPSPPPYLIKLDATTTTTTVTALLWRGTLDGRTELVLSLDRWGTTNGCSDGRTTDSLLLSLALLIARKKSSAEPSSKPKQTNLLFIRCAF